MDYQTISTVSDEYFKRSMFGALIVFLLAIPLSIFAALFMYFVFDGAYLSAVVLVVSFLVSLISISILVDGFRFSQWTLNEFARMALDRFEQSVSVTNNIAVKGRGNVVAVSNTPSQMQSQEVVRLVPVKSLSRLVNGVDENDLRAFVEGIFIRGHSQRSWMGQRLPSGREIESFQDYDALVKPLLVAGVIVDRKERSSGKLVYSSPDEVKQVLGL